MRKEKMILVRDRNHKNNKIKKLSLGLIAGATIFIGGVFISNNTYAAQLFEAVSWNSAKVVYHGQIAFTPSQKTNRYTGYGLPANKYVYNARHNLTRNGSSLLGGIKYVGYHSRSYRGTASRHDKTGWQNPLAKGTAKYSYYWYY